MDRHRRPQEFPGPLAADRQVEKEGCDQGVVCQHRASRRPEPDLPLGWPARKSEGKKTESRDAPQGHSASRHVVAEQEPGHDRGDDDQGKTGDDFEDGRETKQRIRSLPDSLDPAILVVDFPGLLRAVLRLRLGPSRREEERGKQPEGQRGP